MDEIQRIIRTYEKASGQRINLEKTEVSASGNVPEDVLSNLCSRLGAQRVNQLPKYLGLPTNIGRSKKEVFSAIVERVDQKCKTWKVQTLSKADRETMLKAVIQAIPTYTMSCFLLPNDSLHAIEMSIAKFYWEAKEGKSKIHWVGWQGMMRRKDEGGLGFKELKCFNLAMLAKQWWRLHENQNTFIFQILKAKYFPKKDLEEATLGPQPSYLWRSIMQSKVIIEEGLAWCVGNGFNIRATKDRWIGAPYPERVRATSNLVDNNLKVADLIDHELGRWREDVVRQMFPEKADNILATPLCPRLPPDCRVWGFTKHSAYRLAVSIFSANHGPVEDSNYWSQFRKLKVSPKMRNFAWQACNEGLPTMSNLIRRGLNVASTCRLCLEAVEDQSHLFFQCLKTSSVWKLCALKVQDFASMGSFRNFLWASMNRFSKEYVELAVVVAWNIWISRNKVYYDDGIWEEDVVLQRIQRSWQELVSIANKKIKRKVRAETTKLVWNPPDRGWLKLESNVAVISACQIGMGFVVRDADRRVILAAREEMAAAGSSTMLEGLALRFAISTLVSRHITKVEVCSDNQGLIQKILGEIQPNEYEKSITEDIKNLAMMFDGIKFTYIRRELNMAAHFMAKGPSASGLFCNEIPPHITSI